MRRTLKLNCSVQSEAWLGPRCVKLKLSCVKSLDTYSKQPPEFKYLLHFSPLTNRAIQTPCRTGSNQTHFGRFVTIHDTICTFESKTLSEFIVFVFLKCQMCLTVFSWTQLIKIRIKGKWEIILSFDLKLWVCIPGSTIKSTGKFKKLPLPPKEIHIYMA